MPTEIKKIIQDPILLVNSGDRISAFNYNYFEFTHTSPFDYCDVLIGNFRYRLYPINGVYLFNLYEHTKQLFEFKDNVDYSDLSSPIDINQSTTMNFVVGIDTGVSIDYADQYFFNVFNGVFERWEDLLMPSGHVLISETIPVWDGYPLDYSLQVTNDISRVIVNDGLNYYATPFTNMIPADCGGYYLKFHNGRFGYSYYLFSHNAKETFKTKSIGKLREQFSWTDNYLDIGKKGQRKIDLFQYIPYEHREIIKALASSNEVYLYTGEQFSQPAADNYWLEVMLESTTVSETNKENTFSFTAKISLPQEQTRTRI